MAITRSVGVGKARLLGQAPMLEPSQIFSLTLTGKIH